MPVEMFEVDKPITTSLEAREAVRQVIGTHDSTVRLRVTKRDVIEVNQCEASWLAKKEAGFPGWTPAMARGTVVHEAIRLLTGAITSERLITMAVNYAINQLRDRGGSLGVYLSTATPIQLADLRTQAFEIVGKFVHDFPPMGRWLLPRSESKVEFRIGPEIALVSKPDLVVGMPDVQGELVFSDTVGFEFKTSDGGMVLAQAELMFASIVECLRFGAPFARHVAWNATSGHFMLVEPTKEKFMKAVEWVGTSVSRMVELLEGDEPDRSPGGWCEWCPIKDDCFEYRTQ